MAAVEQSGKSNNGKASKQNPDKRAKPPQPVTEADKLKTVVRRLPPNLPEEVFWQSVQPWVTDETVSWKAFHQGKLRKKYNKENVPSRAYIAFRSTELLATFSHAYDGHVFRDKAGNETLAVVEFAPCQKVPPERKKADPRNATIEQDEDFISFVESLKAPVSKPSESDALEALIAATHSAAEPKSTPLLDALRAEKSAQKDKETILKAHAHYRRDGEPLGKREKDEPKRRGGAPGKAADRDEAATPGKKSKRSGKKGGDAKDTSAAPAATGPGPSSKHTAGALGRGGSPAKPSRAQRELPPRTGSSVQSSDAAQKPPFDPMVSGSSSKEVKDKDTLKERTERERRARPTLGIGPAARQFEAALSGAGVERKSRKEREQQRENKGGGTDGDGVMVSESSDKPTPSTSMRGGAAGGSGRRRGDGAKSPSLSGTKAGEAPVIFARIDEPQSPLSPTLPIILTRPTGPDNLPPSRSATNPDLQAASPSGGHGARGGRGARRGGPSEGRGRGHRGGGGGSGVDVNGDGRGDIRGGRRRGRGRGEAGRGARGGVVDTGTGVS